MRYAILATIAILCSALVFCFIYSSRHDSAPLVTAAGQGNLDEVKTLLEKGISINQRSHRLFDWTPLNAAVSYDRTNVIHYLVENHADINLADRDGKTPLMNAIVDGDRAVDLVTYLITNGANINAKDIGGVDAFGYASSDPPKPQILAVIKAALAEQTSNTNPIKRN
jgi:ankyrin repeat protein